MKLLRARNMIDPEHILDKVRRGEEDLLPDASAPPLDDALLSRYISHQVSADESKHVSLLVASFACWRNRYLELVLQSSVRQSNP